MFRFFLSPADFVFLIFMEVPVCLAFPLCINWYKNNRYFKWGIHDRLKQSYTLPGRWERFLKPFKLRQKPRRPKQTFLWSRVSFSFIAVNGKIHAGEVGTDPGREWAWWPQLYARNNGDHLVISCTVKEQSLQDWALPGSGYRPLSCKATI